MSRAGISFDPKQWADAKALLDGLAGRGKVPALAVAAQAATSRTATTIAARVARRIGEEVNLKIADIKKTIDVKRGSYDDPTASITITRQSTWLGDFLSGYQKSQLTRNIPRRRRPSGPLVVDVRKRASGKYGTSQVIVRGFAGIMPRSKTRIGVFQREGRKRVPLHRLRGPTAVGIFIHARGQAGAATVFDEIIAESEQILAKNFDSQIDRFLNR